MYEERRRNKSNKKKIEDKCRAVKIYGSTQHEHSFEIRSIGGRFQIKKSKLVSGHCRF